MNSARYSPPYDAVIFDMDGVLVDSEPVHMAAWLGVLSANGAEASPAMVARGVGVADDDFARRIRAELGIAKHPEELLQEKRQTYLELAKTDVKLCPGALAILEALSDRCDIGMSTSSPREEADLFLDKFEIRPYLRAYNAQDDVRLLKPFPDLYLQTAMELNVIPARCVAVEDSPTGVKAATAAGMPVVAVATTHNRHALHEANAVLASLDPTQRTLDALAMVCCGSVL